MKGRCRSLCLSLGAVFVAVSLLASDSPTSAGSMRTPDLSQLEVDPSKFTKIGLKDDIAIKVAVISAGRAASPRTRWYSLEYVEHENRKGFVPEGESEYVNLFLVSQIEQSRAGESIVKDRYLVVDLWHYYPAQAIKTCHQWTIWEDDPKSAPTRASFQLVAEDFNNGFLGERQVPLDPPTLERLGGFYVTAKAFFAKRVKGLPFDLTRRSWKAHPQLSVERIREPFFPVELER